MKTKFAVLLTISAVLILGSTAQQSVAQQVPDWVKNNAGWWAKGQIDDNSFVQGIQFLIKENIIQIPTTPSSQKSEKIPDWVKSNAGWWADGQIDDATFVKGVQYLISIGVLSIPPVDSATVPERSQSQNSGDTELSGLQAELDKCNDIPQAYKRIDCEKKANAKITLYTYKKSAQIFQVGPMNFYWNGMDSEGNHFEISPSGQAILSVRLLAENIRGQDNVSMMCTGPSICNYDVWNGDKAFKYSGNDFTNGNIVLKPGEFREFNMVFGPNIGYGGTKFEYSAEKNYVFRIQEPWGNTSIPLMLKAP